jgi:hypothetical protein
VTNYRFDADGQTGGVAETGEPVDGDMVFATFTEARDALAEWFREVSGAYRLASLRARHLRKRDVRGGVISITPP